jgi:hypothetical protein
MELRVNTAWKWTKLAQHLHTKTPTQHHLLLILALYANVKGVCWPSYEALMRDGCFGSKHTILKTLVYLRDELKILDWKRGHGNQFKRAANTYTLKQDAMVALLRKQKAEGEKL